MGNQELAILTTKLMMMTTMMTPPIILVPAKRATCWQRNARDRATGHRHYTRCWRLRSFFINRGVHRHQHQYYLDVLGHYQVWHIFIFVTPAASPQMVVDGIPSSNPVAVREFLLDML